MERVITIGKRSGQDEGPRGKCNPLLPDRYPMDTLAQNHKTNLYLYIVYTTSSSATALGLQPARQTVQTRPGTDFGAGRLHRGLVHAEFQDHIPAIPAQDRDGLDGHLAHGPGVDLQLI